MKTDTIELFGKKLLISERSAMDNLDLIEFAQKNQEAEKPDIKVILFVAAQSLSSALKINYLNIPKWRFIKRYKMKRLISPTNLLIRLSPASLYKYQDKIAELEGYTKKKAMVENRSADPLPQA